MKFNIRHTIGTGIALLLIIGGLALFSSAFADDSIDQLEQQISIIEQRIELTKKEYTEIAAEKNEYQEFCNLVRESEAQMRRLNELNNSRRAEVDLILQKVERKKAERPVQ